MKNYRYIYNPSCNWIGRIDESHEKVEFFSNNLWVESCCNVSEIKSNIDFGVNVEVPPEEAALLLSLK